MYTKKFAEHKSAQVKKEYYEDGTIALVSYTTTVAVIDPEGWLSVRGLYSRTTIKHISWFMKEIGSSYYTAKQLYLDSKEMNIHTGEIRDI